MYAYACQVLELNREEKHIPVYFIEQSDVLFWVSEPILKEHFLAMPEAVLGVADFDTNAIYINVKQSIPDAVKVTAHKLAHVWQYTQLTTPGIPPSLVETFEKHANQFAELACKGFYSTHAH
jgi:Zn-dependent peptidase ImmA (M78 family)